MFVVTTWASPAGTLWHEWPHPCGSHPCPFDLWDDQMYLSPRRKPSLILLHSWPGWSECMAAELLSPEGNITRNSHRWLSPIMFPLSRKLGYRSQFTPFLLATMDLNWDIFVKQIVLSSERMDLIIPGAYHSSWLWSTKTNMAESVWRECWEPWEGNWMSAGGGKYRWELSQYLRKTTQGGMDLSGLVSLTICHSRKSGGKGAWSSWWLRVHSQEAESLRYSACLLFFFQSRAPACGTVPPTFRMEFPTLINSI